MALSLPLIRNFCDRIVIVNDSENQSDGSGAQIQRQFANFALSRILRTGYIYNPIQNVAIHPLDPFQTEAEYLEYLKLINTIFAIESDSPSNSSNFRQVELQIPSYTELLLEIFKAIFRKGITVMIINEPYKIVEHFPDTYTQVPGALLHFPRKSRSGNRRVIAIHYRQGVGGMAIYPGQSMPREMTHDYFVRVINDIQSEYPGEIFQLDVYTDAPSKQFEYLPPESQKNLWYGSPNFDGNRILINSNSFSHLASLTGLQPNVISGGNPIEAILGMACSEFLVMGKSSLSYVSAILNSSGTVYYPPNFWHRPMKRWIQV